MKKIRAFLHSFTPRRRVIYLLGTLILGCGIAMNTKTQLGIAPILSVAWNLSELIGIPFSLMSFFYYCFLILLQLLLLGREFEQAQWLQLLASFFTSFFIGLFGRVLPPAVSPAGKAAMLLGAILLTGTGIILTVGARFVPNPGDGMAAAIARRTGKSLGLSKNILDISSFLLAAALGFLFRGRLMGVGAGTVVTMLLTGRVVALLQKPLMHLSGLDREG
jgi:uncharacterized membrane protein YczE